MQELQVGINDKRYCLLSDSVANFYNVMVVLTLGIADPMINLFLFNSRPLSETQDIFSIVTKQCVGVIFWRHLVIESRKSITTMPQKVKLSCFNTKLIY